MALDKLLQWTNIAYMVCVAIAAVGTLAIYHLPARPNAAKDRELEKYRTESTIKITTAKAEAAEAMKIAESERLVRAELEFPADRAGPNSYETKPQGNTYQRRKEAVAESLHSSVFLVGSYSG